MAFKDFQAFTVKYNPKTNVIKTPAGISVVNDSNITETQAIWDTGATSCAITKSLAEQISLPQVSMTNVMGVHGAQQVPVYLVNIYLPNKVAFAGMRVTQCNELSADGKVGILIGMDVINMGDFTITNKDNQTWFSFRFPSLKHIDYVKEHRIQEIKKQKGFRQTSKKKK